LRWKLTEHRPAPLSPHGTGLGTTRPSPSS